MPRRDPPYFSVTCTEAELRKRLRICENSDYRVERESVPGLVTVHDGKTVVLRAELLGGGVWLARIHRAYHRHPFGPPFRDDALPGVP